MNSHTLVMILLVMGSVLTAGLAHAQEGSDKSGQNCVEWVAKKRMFLLSEQSVTGKSCALGLEITRSNDTDAQPTENEFNYLVTATVAHQSFDSEEPERDRIVSALLGGRKHPHLVFRAEPLNSEGWQRLKNGTLSSVTGKLQIGERIFPVSWTLSYKGQVIIGELSTQMKRFDVEPPTVVGGAVAKVLQPLILRFRLSQETLRIARNH